MIDHFSLLAPYYDRFIGPYDPTQLGHLLRLPTPGRLLDAGGGTGRVSAALLPLVGQLIINDISGRMLKQAQAKGPLQPGLARVERLPYPDHSFDRVLVVDALHHFPHQQQAIQELLRVLKPGGRLVIEEPNIHHFGVKLVALAEKLMLMQSHFLTPQQIRHLITTHGQPAHIEQDDHYTAWVISDKN